jgi:hypothetical protein
MSVESPPKENDLPTTISAEEFYDSMAARDPLLPHKLQDYLTRLKPLDVDPEFKRSLILRWQPPSGSSVNLGYIMRDGGVWTDQLSQVRYSRPGSQYLEELARIWSGDVKKDKLGRPWYVTINNRAPGIEQIADKFDGWYDAIAHFIKALQGDYTDAATPSVPPHLTVSA